MSVFSLLVEFAISLFDAALAVYFISGFNNASLSPKKNKFAIPTVLIIFGFSVLNDLFLSGFILPAGSP